MIIVIESGMLKLRARLAALSLFSLLAGIALYLGFRDMDMVFFRWLGFAVGREPPPAARGAVLSFAAYNLPDGLWLLSGILMIRAVWLDAPKMVRAYKLAFCLFAFAYEALQLTRYAHGTFDVLDIAVMATAALIEGGVHTFLTRRRKKCVKTW